MRELSLNILDIAQNSIKANAKLISIDIVISTSKDRLYVDIKDDGQGMDAETLKKATDPFYTERTTRKVGMGLPLFKHAAEITGGSFSVDSAKGEGTHVKAELRLSSLDLLPLGNLTETIMTLILGAEHHDIEFSYQADENRFSLSTAELKKQLEFSDFGQIEVLEFLRSYLIENIDATNGGLVI